MPQRSISQMTASSDRSSDRSPATLRRGVLIWALTVCMTIAAAGCAGAYHDYPCGTVPYAYCPPPPLPYDTYHGCPTPVAQCYLAGTMDRAVGDELLFESNNTDPGEP